MSLLHKNLAQEHWAKMSFAEQMANIGSEMGRAFAWRSKNNLEYARKSSERVIELMLLTLDQARSFSQKRELSRLREIFCDFFYGDNQYHSEESFFNKYFLQFNYISRKHL